MKDGRLAVLDQTAIPGGVDRIHDLGKRLFQLLSQFRRQLIPIHYHSPLLRCSFSGISTPDSHIMPSARKFGHAQISRFRPLPLLFPGNHYLPIPLPRMLRARFELGLQEI